MATQNKNPFKLNVLGLLNLETENLTFNQKLIILIAVMLFMIIIVALLKTYAIPALSMPGIIKKAGSIKNIFKSRSP